MKLPDLNLLPALLALLEEGSVTRAAARVGLSVPAMSHALGRLRIQLADPLLVRAGQRMTLTPRAVELRPRVATALEQATAALRPESAAVLTDLARTFRIHATDHALTILGPRIDRGTRAAPKVSLHVLPNQRDETRSLRDGAIDLAIGVYDYSPYSELPSELRIQQLLSDDFVCVVRAEHPTVRAKLGLAEYAALDHLQIVPRGEPGGYVDELLAAHGLQRRIARAVPYFLAALVLTASSDYVLTVSRRLARPMASKLGLRLVPPPPELGLEPYALSQIWHPRDDRDPAHRWLRSVVAHAAEARA
ncbi:MAG: LysR family transcriptional regulator [Myxococcales bacterium]|nr:LysR family transcriptional regulator [Myxococcales bacterium]